MKIVPNKTGTHNKTKEKVIIVAMNAILEIVKLLVKVY